MRSIFLLSPLPNATLGRFRLCRGAGAWALPLLMLVATWPAQAALITNITTRGDGKTMITFTAGSGTWTVPAGVNSLEVLVVGGGGGGGQQSSGAGAGGMYYASAYAVTPGSSVNVAVGAGGLGGSGPGNYV